MIRIFDVLLSVFGLVMFSPLIMLLMLIGFIDTGSPIFLQERVGRSKCPFILLKFRTMRVGTTSVASHLANSSSITAYGRILRRTKLDELPQLWNVLLGDMSLVGPRPCLYNQEKLISERSLRGVFDARPGITGLAQIRNVDMSTPELLAVIDKQMLDTLDFKNYVYYIVMTLFGRGKGDAVFK